MPWLHLHPELLNEVVAAGRHVLVQYPVPIRTRSVSHSCKAEQRKRATVKKLRTMRQAVGRVYSRGSIRRLFFSGKATLPLPEGYVPRWFGRFDTDSSCDEQSVGEAGFGDSACVFALSMANDRCRTWGPHGKEVQYDARSNQV